MNALKKLLTVLVLVGAPLASAGQDTFYLGEGKAGFKTVRAEEIFVPNKYVRATAFEDRKTIRVHSDNDFNADGFAAEKLVLVLQTVGQGLGSADSTELDLDSHSNGKVGRWEFARLADVVDTGSTGKLILKEELVNEYDSDLTQVISVPEYVSLTVETRGRIEATKWNGTQNTGGVIAFLVRNSLVVNGQIVANGAGFRGGSITSFVCLETDDGANIKPSGRGEGLQKPPSGYDDTTQSSLSNGGGGGSCTDAGGGGGGGAGAGGLGGKTKNGLAGGGSRGAKIFSSGGGVNAFPWRLVLGGGGGRGKTGQNGADGGGAILIRAGSLFGSGVISADGAKATDHSGNGGGGGGGGGGTIILRTADEVICPDLSANGGGGGSTSGATSGPGGGGGGGRIIFQSAGYCPLTVSPGAAGKAGTGSPSERGAGPGLGGEDIQFENRALTPPGNAVVLSVTPEQVQGGYVNVNRPSIIVDAPAGRTVYLRFNGGEKVKFLGKTSDGKYYVGTPAGVLPEGTNTVVAVAEFEGLWGAESPALTFKVDTVPPNTLLTGIKPPALDKSSSARFVFDASDTLSGVAAFKCKLDPATVYSDCSKDTTFAGLASGNHVLRVQAIDHAGNPKDPTLYAPAKHEWEIDLGVPAAPIVTDPKPLAFVNNASYPIVGTAEPGIKVLVYVDNRSGAEVLANASGVWTYIPSPPLEPPAVDPPGLHRVRAVTVDAAGNVSPFSSTVPFTLDIAAPPITFTYPERDKTIRDNPVVVKGTTEPGSTVTIKLLNGDRNEISDVGGTASAVAAAPGSWSYELETKVSLADGTYFVQATARDAAGNTTPGSIPELRFVLDRTSPNTTMNCPDAFTNAPTVTFTFGPDSDTVAYDCVLGDEFSTTPMSCNGSLSVHKVTESGTRPDGKYTFMARAKDAVGNVDPSPRICTWTWDQTPPGPVEIIGPEKVTDSTLAVFHFSALDAEGDRSGPVGYE